MQNKEHPIRDIIKKCVGTYNIVAVVEEDTQTLDAMKQTTGLISFLCTITKNNNVLAQGRGSAILSPTNRFINRAVYSAFNSALADGFIRSTKVLDTFRTNAEESGAGVALGEAYQADSVESTPATLRQLEYLKQLLQVNADEEVRDKWMSNLDTLTKFEASELIQQYAAK